MVITAIIGIIILAIIIFVTIRIVKNVLIGVVLIGLILFASFVILGSIPSLRSIPVIGPILPRVPSSLGEVISIIDREEFWDIIMKKNGKRYHVELTKQGMRIQRVRTKRLLGWREVDIEELRRD